MGVEEYRSAINNILPAGIAWRDDDFVVEGLAQECQRLDDYIINKLNNSFPDKTTESLGLWEKDWGLPDPCFLEFGNVEARRLNLVAKIKSEFTFNSVSIKALIFDLTGKTSEVITNDVFRVGDYVGNRLYNSDFIFTYTVKLDSPCETADDYFRAGNLEDSGRVGDRLWGLGDRPSVCDKLIRCVLDKYTPLHLRYYLEGATI